MFPFYIIECSLLAQSTIALDQCLSTGIPTYTDRTPGSPDQPSFSHNGLFLLCILHSNSQSKEEGSPENSLHRSSLPTTTLRRPLTKCVRRCSMQGRIPHKSQSQTNCIQLNHRTLECLMPGSSNSLCPTMLLTSSRCLMTLGSSCSRIQTIWFAAT